MHGDLLSPPPVIPEWRHSTRFFLLAIALHLAVLFAPLDLLPKAAETAPDAVTVKLVAPEPRPLAPIAPAKASTTPPSPPRQEKYIPRQHPVLAVAPDPVAPATSFVVPPQPVSPNPAAIIAAAPTVSPARFDAAYLNNPSPEYPRLSRQLGEEGKVLLRVRVRADGTAAAVDLEKGSNFDRLDEAARRAVTRWRFVPAKRGDEAVEASVIVPIVFRLDS